MKDRQAAAVERLAFFSDAVFAIAMTLLVVEVRVPHLDRPGNVALADALGALMPNYIGFVVSFAVLARFWIGHHRILGLVRSVSPGAIGANLSLLFTVAFTPFPTAVLCDYVDLNVAGMVYALWLVVIGIANMAFVRAALRDPGHLHADATDAEVRLSRTNAFIPVIAGLVAAAISVLSSVLGVAALIVTTSLLGLAARRRHAPVAAPAEADGR